MYFIKMQLIFHFKYMNYDLKHENNVSLIKIQIQYFLKYKNYDHKHEIIFH